MLERARATQSRTEAEGRRAPRARDEIPRESLSLSLSAWTLLDSPISSDLAIRFVRRLAGKGVSSLTCRFDEFREKNLCFFFNVCRLR